MPYFQPLLYLSCRLYQDFLIKKSLLNIIFIIIWFALLHLLSSIIESFHIWCHCSTIKSWNSFNWFIHRDMLVYLSRDIPRILLLVSWSRYRRRFKLWRIDILFIMLIASTKFTIKLSFWPQIVWLISCLKSYCFVWINSALPISLKFVCLCVKCRCNFIYFPSEFIILCGMRKDLVESL